VGSTRGDDGVEKPINCFDIDDGVSGEDMLDRRARGFITILIDEDDINGDNDAIFTGGILGVVVGMDSGGRVASLATCSFGSDNPTNASAATAIGDVVVIVGAIVSFAAMMVSKDDKVCTCVAADGSRSIGGIMAELPVS
jgi:hypothetical protein